MPAARPFNSRLDCAKLTADFGITLPDWNAGWPRLSWMARPRPWCWETTFSSAMACPEEIAFEQGWIDTAHLLKRAELFGKTQFGAYLKQLATQGGQ